MLSNRPYLLRAFYQWIVDNGCNPILVIDATHPRAKIPQGYAEGGEIIFNISTTAVRDLKMTNEIVEFKASFSGVIHIISAPTKAVLAIYAEENGEGIFFDAEEDSDSGSETEGSMRLTGIDRIEDFNSLEQQASSTDASVNKAKPFLKLVE